MGLLIFPLLFQGDDVHVASLSFADNTLRLTHDRRVNHLPIQGPGSSSLLVCLLVRYRYPHSPLQLVFARSKCLLNDLHLTRMDTLLAVEAKPFPSTTLVLQSLLTFGARVRSADEIDG